MLMLLLKHESVLVILQIQIQLNIKISISITFRGLINVLLFGYQICLSSAHRPTPPCPHVLLTFMSFLQIANFFKIEFHSMQRLNSHYEGWSSKKKKKKMKIIEENSIERTQGKKCLLTLDLKPFISQVKGKHSAGQRIPESSCVRKETVGIEILIRFSRKGDRKIMQPIGITSETVTRMRKWNLFSQFR